MKVYATARERALLCGHKGSARACARELTCRLACNIALAPSMYSVLGVWVKTLREEPRTSRLFVMIMITRSEHLARR